MGAGELQWLPLSCGAIYDGIPQNWGIPELSGTYKIVVSIIALYKGVSCGFSCFVFLLFSWLAQELMLGAT